MAAKVLTAVVADRVVAAVLPGAALDPNLYGETALVKRPWLMRFEGLLNEKCKKG